MRKWEMRNEKWEGEMRNEKWEGEMRNEKWEMRNEKWEVLWARGRMGKNGSLVKNGNISN